MSSATGGLEDLKDHNFGIIIVVCLKMLYRYPPMFRFPMVSLDIFSNIIFLAAPWLWGRLSL